MKKLIFSLALTAILFPAGSWAQSFAPEIIGSAGTFATSASGSMSWTIGEVMTETYSSTGNFFTQGFHQPDSLVIISVANPIVQNFSIYPNPVTDNLYLDFSGTSGSFTIEIFDMQGKILNSEIISSNEKKVKVSFSEFANGIYLLNIVNSESNTRNSYKINKSE